MLRHLRCEKSQEAIITPKPSWQEVQWVWESPVSHGATWEELPERKRKPAGTQPPLESAAKQKRSPEDKAQKPSVLSSPTSDSLAEFNQKLVRRGLGFAVHRDQLPQAKSRAESSGGSRGQ